MLFVFDGNPVLKFLGLVFSSLFLLLNFILKLINQALSRHNMPLLLIKINRETIAFSLLKLWWRWQCFGLLFVLNKFLLSLCKTRAHFQIWTSPRRKLVRMQNRITLGRLQLITVMKGAHCGCIRSLKWTNCVFLGIKYMLLIRTHSIIHFFNLLLKMLNSGLQAIWKLLLWVLIQWILEHVRAKLSSCFSDCWGFHGSLVGVELLLELLDIEVIWLGAVAILLLVLAQHLLYVLFWPIKRKQLLLLLLNQRVFKFHFN